MLLNEVIVLRMNVVEKPVRLHRRIAEAHARRAQAELRKQERKEQADGDCFSDLKPASVTAITSTPITLNCALSPSTCEIGRAHV